MQASSSHLAPSPWRLIIPSISNVAVTRRYAALQPLNSRPHLYMIFTLAWAGVFYRLHPTPLIGEGRRTLYYFLKIFNSNLGILSIVKTITFSFIQKRLISIYTRTGKEIWKPGVDVYLEYVEKYGRVLGVYQQ